MAGLHPFNSSYTEGYQRGEEQWVDEPGPGQLAQLPMLNPSGVRSLGNQPHVDAGDRPLAPIIRPNAQQDMVFQWMDCPQPARQQFNQAQVPGGSPLLSMPPYFQSGPAYGVPPGAGSCEAAVGAASQVQPTHEVGHASAYSTSAQAQGDPRAVGHQRPATRQQGRSPGSEDPRGEKQRFETAVAPKRVAAPVGRGCGKAGAEGSCAKGRGRQAGTGWQTQNSDSGYGGGSTSQLNVFGMGGDSRRPASIETPGAEAQLAATLQGMGETAVRELLCVSLESIYRDRIKPLANYVKGRLKERFSPEPIVKHFILLYSKYSDLFNVKEPTQGEEASIYFNNEPHWFQGWVDIDSPEDPYDEAMWEALHKYLEGEHTFAGGRYGMARELKERNLPFLNDYTLGSVCHIVQLAIQHRKIIVYHRKMLKPIQSIVGHQPIANGSGNAGGESEVEDMDRLTTLLFRMLVRHPGGVQLSRMKQMIKNEFGSTVSEIAFQCTKLSELFNREPLMSIFKLDTDDGGKAIYIRLGDTRTFSEHVKTLYADAVVAEDTPEEGR
eukprot:TRINITY_DN49045_c0_g1_i1.p1 TRINITY_DN49045_c0_g1~~TRINITY_DN49045_c0_g1_i1.p1  ORF type:complete len:552 (-),score=68.84 TRINITY_DN49045_c0_g1_i1:266-1921(-)